MQHQLPIHLILQSQILPSLLYSDTEGKAACFAAPESFLHIMQKAPVFLGSLQDFPDMTMFPDIGGMIQHPYPYPPREHGTIALILDTGQQYQYHLKDLPQEAQERQKKISQLIEKMQSLPQEETFNVFVDCPEELKTMVQQLAEDYYQYHQHNTGNKPIPATADAFNAEE